MSESPNPITPQDIINAQQEIEAQNPGVMWGDGELALFVIEYLADQIGISFVPVEEGNTNTMPDPSDPRVRPLKRMVYEYFKPSSS